MFAAFLDTYPLREMISSMPVCPFPSMSNRAAWEEIDPADREDLLLYAESFKDTPYPLLTAAQFMAFVRDGSRKAYEEPYFLRRKKLIASVLHMCVTGTDDALDDVINGVWCICEESSWVISAHNVNPHPGAPKAQDKPLPEIDDPYIDLFAGQTAMILSLASALVGDALDGQAPVVRRRIGGEIERRILTPFMTRDDFWWMGFIRKDLCNWTPWIISNILLTASLEWRDPLRFAQLADRACRMLDRWLDVMPQDGGCDEGTAYYNMAGGALLDCLQLLERATEGKMTFWHVEKIRNILNFPLKTQLKNGWFVNFADCDARPFLCGERLQLAGEKLADRALEAMGVQLRGTAAEQIADVPHFSRLLSRLFHPAAALSAARLPARDVWLPDLELRVIERAGMILCAKGGHNGESHNHNDVGSFMLYVDGEPQIIDMGNKVYTAKTFGPERYTLDNTRAKNHNIPMIGDAEQAPGSEFAAQHVCADESGVRMDIAGAYPKHAGVRSLVRSLRMEEDAVVLADDAALSRAQEITWVFMLRHEPKTQPGAIRAGGITMVYDPALSARIEEMPVTDARMARNFPGSLWRLTLTARQAKAHTQTFIIKRAD